MDAPVLPTILQALQQLDKGNKLHENVMLAFMGVLAIFGLFFFIFGFLNTGPERIAGWIGGPLFSILIVWPYNKIQELRKQNIVFGMLAAVIDRFQDKMGAETLNDLMKQMLRSALKE